MSGRTPSRRGFRFKLVSLSASWLISGAVHVAFGVLLALLPEKVQDRYEIVDLEVRERQPEPEPEPEPEPDEPDPEPDPEPEPKPKPRPRPRPDPDPEPEPEPPPAPPPDAEEAPPDAEEAPPVFELGDNTFAEGKGAGWKLNRSEGNTKFAAVARPGQESARGTKVESDPEGEPGGTGFAPVPKKDLSRPPRPRSGRISIPPYPEEARREGVEGAVLLQVFIDREGGVRKVRILKDPGGGLGEVARRAMLRERWKPALNKRGQPVDTVIPYRYRFVLDG